MLISTLRILALAMALVLAGCGNDPTTTEESAADTTTSPQTSAADDSAPQTETPQHVATRVVARSQEIMYASSDEIQQLIRLDTTDTGRLELNDIVRNQLAPVRAFLADATPGTTWYLVRPLTTDIDQHTDTTATVTVWSMELFSREGFTNPETWWWLTELEMVNENGQWLVHSYHQTPGPAAQPGTDHWPSSAAELDAELDGHRLIDAYDTTP